MSGRGQIQRAAAILRWALYVVVGLMTAGTLALWLGVFVLDPQAWSAKAFIRDLPLDQIRSISLEPLPREPKALHAGRIVLSGRGEIAAVVGELRQARPWRPNHPTRRWATVLRFETGGRAFSGVLVSTYDQGVLFYYGQDAFGGPVYGTYRRDDLGTLVERLALQQSR